MTLQRTFKPENFHINHNNGLMVIDYMEMLGTNENIDVPLERRIEEMNEYINMLREELYRVTHVNINYTIQPNGNG